MDPSRLPSEPYLDPRGPTSNWKYLGADAQEFYHRSDVRTVILLRFSFSPFIESFAKARLFAKQTAPRRLPDQAIPAWTKQPRDKRPGDNNPVIDGT
jgi:hypothetical protein